MFSYSSLPKNFVKTISFSLSGAALASTLVFANQASAATVNGNVLTARQDSKMTYVANNVVPRLIGDRNQRLDKAARVAWWSLKEGVFDVDNAIRYSNCGASGVGRIDTQPLKECPTGKAWQVGLAAIQATTTDVTALENLTKTLFPKMMVSSVLANTATEAGYGPSTSEHKGILDSIGRVRGSWLLRISAVGFEKQAPVVKSECIDDSKSWCYGEKWDATKRFAPNRAAALKSIADIRAILAERAPK